jgi:hypothetical protein
MNANAAEIATPAQPAGISFVLESSVEFGRHTTHALFRQVAARQVMLATNEPCKDVAYGERTPNS